MFNRWNERVKNLTVMDIGFTKFAAFFFAIIIVKLFPQLLNINYGILIALVLFLGLEPLYNFWRK